MDIPFRPPLISIIIPVYNMANGIRRCLHSVVNQKTEDTEVIVVDDGSTDDTCLVVQEFADRDSSIRFFRQTNAGASAARNAGIDAARGIYLLFIDADDEIDDGYLHNISVRAKESGADMLVWGLKRHFSDGHIEEWKPKLEGNYSRKDFLSVFPSQHYGKMKGLYGFVPNKLVKKELVDQFGLRFNTELCLQEDYDFYLDCYAHCETFHCFGETGYRYYLSDGSDRPKGKRNISYPQLIGVQNKCVDLLKKEGAWTAENEKRVLGAIGNLTLSIFLETRDKTFATIRAYMDYIWESPYCLPAIKMLNTRWKLLRRLILRRDVPGACIFVRHWRSYMFLRTKGKS